MGGENTSQHFYIIISRIRGRKSTGDFMSSFPTDYTETPGDRSKWDLWMRTLWNATQQPKISGTIHEYPQPTRKPGNTLQAGETESSG